MTRKVEYALQLRVDGEGYGVQIQKCSAFIVPPARIPFPFSIVAPKASNKTYRENTFAIFDNCWRREDWGFLQTRKAPFGEGGVCRGCAQVVEIVITFRSEEGTFTALNRARE
jgi:hypothetical protein